MGAVSDLDRHRVRAHFAAQRAVAPGEAIEYAPPGAGEMSAFTELRRSGLIRDAAPGHYWLDLDRMASERKRISRAKIAGAVVLAALGMVVLMLVFRVI